MNDFYKKRRCGTDTLYLVLTFINCQLVHTQTTLTVVVHGGGLLCFCPLVSSGKVRVKKSTESPGVSQSDPLYGVNNLDEM